MIVNTYTIDFMQRNRVLRIYYANVSANIAQHNNNKYNKSEVILNEYHN